MAGTKRLDITLGLNTQPAQQAAQAHAATQKKLVDQVLTDVEVAERARTELIRRANQQRIADTVRAVEAVRAATTQSVEKVTSVEAQAFSQRMAKLREEQQARNRALEERKAKTKQALDYELAAMAWNHRETMEAWDRERTRREELNSSIKAGAVALGTLGAALAVNLVQHWDKIKQDAFEAAEAVMRMRGAVRELQALRGELGDTGAGTVHVHEMAAKTLQKPEEVMAMEAAGLGVGELALKNDKDREQFEKAMVAAGKMQAMEGGDAGAYGQMIGQIALQSQGPIDAEEMEARANRLYKIQQPGGFKTMSQAMGQYAKLNSLVQNGVYTPEEAMGLASAFSVSSPDEAATRTQQFTRSVMSGRLKERAPHLAEGVDPETTAAYFKGLGITENDSAVARGKKIADDLAKQKAANPKFNAHEYLLTHGFANMEDREAVMSFAGLRNSGNLEKIEAAQNAPLEKGAISKRFNEKIGTDNRLKKMALENTGNLAETKIGLEEEPLALAQEAAFNRLNMKSKGYKDFKEWKAEDAHWYTRGWADLMGGRHSQVNQEASRVLQEQRKALGLPQLGTFQFSGEDEARKRSAQEVQAAGGDVTGGAYQKALPEAAADLKQVAKDLRVVVERLDDRKGKVNAPLPGKPAAIPMRP